MANPSALMLAAALVLEHLDMGQMAQAVRAAIGDRVGQRSTDEFADAVSERLR